MANLTASKEETIKGQIRNKISELRTELEVRICVLIIVIIAIVYGLYSADKSNLDHCISCGFEPDRCRQFNWCNGYCFCGYNPNESIDYTFVGVVSFGIIFICLLVWGIFFHGIVDDIGNLKALL